VAGARASTGGLIGQGGSGGTTAVRRWLVGAGVAFLVAVFSTGGVWRLLYPLPYGSLVRAAAARYDVSPYLVAAVMRAESKGDATALSRRGALGLMQVMPATGQWAAGRMRLSGFTTASLRDPATNLAVGTWYLKSLLEHYSGNLALALAAYNGGENTVDRWLNSHEWAGGENSVEEIPFVQTRDFVRGVLASYEAYRELYPDLAK
jgi:soluble lytic murein transglycosylase